MGVAVGEVAVGEVAVGEVAVGEAGACACVGQAPFPHLPYNVLLPTNTLIPVPIPRRIEGRLHPSNQPSSRCPGNCEAAEPAS